MKKILVLLLMLPSFVSAAPFVKDAYDATDSNATSTFAGNLAVIGDVQFGIGDGIVSLVNGMLQTVEVTSPLTFSDSILSFNASTSGLMPYSGAVENLNMGDFRISADAITSTSGGFTAYNNDGVNFYSDNGETLTGNIYASIVGEYSLTNPSLSTSQSILDVTQVGPEDQRFIFPNTSGTFGLVEADQTWTGVNFFESDSEFNVRVSYDESNPDYFTRLILDSGLVLQLDSGPNGNSELQFDGGGVTLTGSQGLSFRSGEEPFNFQRLSTSGTTTVNFGAVGEIDSRSCFNTKNTAGDDISFYFVGTTMVVENNACVE